MFKPDGFLLRSQRPLTSDDTATPEAGERVDADPGTAAPRRHPQEGNLLLVTIDPDELLDIARRSLTREFTDTECTRFGFTDDCPTLGELRGQPDGADDPAVLNGAYEVAWSSDQFNAALAAAGQPKMAGRASADGYPATYTTTIHDGRYQIDRDGTEAYCIGSYTVTGDQVHILAERFAVGDSRVGCFPGRTFLDATFELTDDGLRLTVTDGHPGDAVLFGSQRLAPPPG